MFTYTKDRLFRLVNDCPAGLEPPLIRIICRDVCTRYGFAEFSIGEDVEFVQGFLSRYLR